MKKKLTFPLPAGLPDKVSAHREELANQRRAIRQPH